MHAGKKRGTRYPRNYSRTKLSVDDGTRIRVDGERKNLFALIRLLSFVQLSRLESDTSFTASNTHSTSTILTRLASPYLQVHSSVERSSSQVHIHRTRNPLPIIITFGLIQSYPLTASHISQLTSCHCPSLPHPALKGHNRRLLLERIFSCASLFGLYSIQVSRSSFERPSHLSCSRLPYPCLSGLQPVFIQGQGIFVTPRSFRRYNLGVFSLAQTHRCLSYRHHELQILPTPERDYQFLLSSATFQSYIYFFRILVIVIIGILFLLFLLRYFLRPILNGCSFASTRRSNALLTLREVCRDSRELKGRKRLKESQYRRRSSIWHGTIRSQSILLRPLRQGSWLQVKDDNRFQVYSTGNIQTQKEGNKERIERTTQASFKLRNTGHHPSHDSSYPIPPFQLFQETRSRTV
ncbi:hypothetical protein VTL71DRAFT_7964 [Oculimacula yallundae]|uniref:Uncharacterized protein n=1 Tax=Oculimacula yallundae TaxID=86028 RepID=A0ABR4CW79_9HELO